MTTQYHGMTPWEYNEWARSREGGGGGHPDYDFSRRQSQWSGNSTNFGGAGPGGEDDVYKDIDRSPFELKDSDALVLAQQQRVRDATAYKFNLAGLPQPIEMWSGNLADTQRQNMPLGTVASLMPGTGAFPGSESYRNYALAREAYMGDPIRAAQAAIRSSSQQSQQSPQSSGQLPPNILQSISHPEVYAGLGGSPMSSAPEPQPRVVQPYQEYPQQLPYYFG